MSQGTGTCPLWESMGQREHVLVALAITSISSVREEVSVGPSLVLALCASPWAPREVRPQRFWEEVFHYPRVLVTREQYGQGWPEYLCGRGADCQLGDSCNMFEAHLVHTPRSWLLHACPGGDPTSEWTPGAFCLALGCCDRRKPCQTLPLALQLPPASAAHSKGAIKLEFLQRPFVWPCDHRPTVQPAPRASLACPPSPRSCTGPLPEAAGGVSCPEAGSDRNPLHGPQPKPFLPC